MGYSIVPATITHVHQISPRLRDADAREARMLGFPARRLLRSTFRDSIYAKTAFIDGEIAAMWGLRSPLLSDSGQPWLVTTGVIEKLPVAFVREAKREVSAMLALRPRLEDYVIADYRGAVRLLEVLGFALDAPAPYGRGVFRRFALER